MLFKTLSASKKSISINNWNIGFVRLSVLQSIDYSEFECVHQKTDYKKFLVLSIVYINALQV